MKIKENDKVWINKNTTNNSDIFPTETEVLEFFIPFKGDPDTYLLRYNEWVLHDDAYHPLDHYNICYQLEEIFLTREACLADLKAHLLLRKAKFQSKLIEIDEFINALAS